MTVRSSSAASSSPPELVALEETKKCISPLMDKVDAFSSEDEDGNVDESSQDLRAVRPRLVPRLSRVDRRRNDGEHLLYPYWIPSWLRRIHDMLPWINVFKRSGGGPWLSVTRSEVPNLTIFEEVTYRWKSIPDRWTLLLRCSMAFTTLFVLFILNVVTSTPLQPPANVDHIVDRFHDLFYPLNKAVRENKALFSAFMVTGSLMMDIVVCWIFGYWALLGDSMRLPIAYGLLYGVRSLIRRFTIFPFPADYVWGFPQVGKWKYHSLTVPFTIADDFFYSGHVGCATLAAIEHYYNKCWIGMGFSIMAALVTVFLMLTCRSHYMIDMLTGAAMASWYHMVAQKIAVYIDETMAFPPRPIANREKFMARWRKPAYRQATPEWMKFNEVSVPPTTTPRRCANSRIQSSAEDGCSTLAVAPADGTSSAGGAVVSQNMKDNISLSN